MGKMSEGFLSDDGQTFTSLVESNEPEIDDNNNENIESDNASDQIDKLLGKIDIENLPENQRASIKQLTDAVRGMKSELAGAKKDSDMSVLLQELIKKVNQPSLVKSDEPLKKRELLVDQLKFDDPEKDYYAPHLKLLASAIDKMMDEIGGIGKRFDESTKSTFVKDVQTFIKSNNIPAPVIKKMDEIAKVFGPGAYNDLERLFKYAKHELGIKTNPNQRSSENSDGGNVMEFRGKRRSESNVDNKPAKTMQEAWDQAEESLANEE